MLKSLLLSAAVGAALMVGPAAFAADTMDKAKAGVNDTVKRVEESTVGRKIQLSAVPAPAMAAAHKEIGTNLTEAEQRRDNGQMVYEIEGRDSANKKHSVHVTADGKVLKKD